MPRGIGRLKKINWHWRANLPAHEIRHTVATVCTIGRIVLAPIIVGAMVYGAWRIAFWCFVLASATDILDGLLARWFNQRTYLGACLDPIADKLLLVSCFATLTFVQSPLFTIPIWFLLVVLCKEVLLITGACVVYAIKGYLPVEPTKLGKMTTFVQTCFIIWLFTCYFFHWVPTKTYYTMLGLLLVLVCASFVQYARIGARLLRT